MVRAGYSQVNDSLRLEYNYINSNPQDAGVYVNDELIGNTPLYFLWPDTVFPKIVKIKLKNYAQFSETFLDGGLISKTYNLVPFTGFHETNPVKENKGSYFEKRRKDIPIVVSSVVALGAGISAYYFKKLSVDNRDAYNETGDPAALDRKNKYDILSGVSLVVFQLGFCALIYYMFVN